VQCTLDPFDGGLEAEVDAACAHLAHQRLADIVVEATEDEARAVELRRRHAEAGEEPRELAGDVAAAEHDSPPWLRGHAEQRIAHQAMFRPRKLGQHRLPSRGDDDVARGDALLPHRDGVGVDQRRLGIDDAHARAVEQAAVDAGEALHLRRDGLLQRAPVMAAHVHVPAEAARILGPGAVLGGLDHQLLRHAADIDAGAAPETPFRDRNLRAVPGRDAPAAHPRRAAADDEEINVHPLPPIQRPKPVRDVAAVRRMASGFENRSGAALWP
jgi:hypothetical protein